MDIAEWFQDQLDLAGLVTALLGALILAIAQRIRRLLVGAGRRLRGRKDWYERLTRLRTDVSLEYFEQELGLHHAFRTPSGMFVELIYPHKWFFVQALVNSDGVVAFYALTSRDKDFQPPIWPTSTSPQSVPAVPHQPLGSVPFAETWHNMRADGAAAFFSGATANTFYFESHGGGNPGNYLGYVVAYNDAGHSFFDFAEVYSEDLFTQEMRVGRAAADYDDVDNVEAFLAQPQIERFRSGACPNTYGIIGQTYPFKEPLPRYVGPDRIQVRTL